MDINNENTIEVYNRLRMFRKHSKLTQQSIADIIGIRQASYSDIECGKTLSISKPIQNSLEAKLNLNLNWLFTGKGEMIIDKNIGNQVNDDQVFYHPKERSDDLKLITLEYSDFKKMVETIKRQEETISRLSSGKNGTAGTA